MPAPGADNKLQIPHLRDYVVGKCPAVAGEEGGGGLGSAWTVWYILLFEYLQCLNRRDVLKGISFEAK